MSPPPRDWVPVAILAAVFAALFTSLLLVVRYEESERRTCVQACRAGGWSPDEGQCERLCADSPAGP